MFVSYAACSKPKDLPLDASETALWEAQGVRYFISNTNISMPNDSPAVESVITLAGDLPQFDSIQDVRGNVARGLSGHRGLTEHYTNSEFLRLTRDSVVTRQTTVTPSDHAPR